MTSGVVLNEMTSDDSGKYYEFHVLVKTSEPIDDEEQNSVANAILRAARVQMAHVRAKRVSPDKDVMNAAKNLAYWLSCSMDTSDNEKENELIDRETAKAINGMKSAIENAEEYLAWSDGKFDGVKDENAK